MFMLVNPNPEKRIVGDCVIRAIAILLDTSWGKVYEDICVLGRMMYDDGGMMSMERGYSGTESKEHLMHEIDEMQRKLQQM